MINENNIKKLSEISINPLRIAFDHWELRDIYERAIRLAAQNEIKKLSNYLLYNYKDKPIDLYNRMKLNIELCEELGIDIYSFPMKYHPIDESKYFRNRNFIGKHWNRKFIRAVQAVLNSTKGKIGKGKKFFEKAFGATEQEFEKILFMPEPMIIYRFHYEENGLEQQWWKDFDSLPEKN